MGVMKHEQARQKQKKQKKEKRPFGAVEVQTVESDEWQKLNYMEAHVYNTLKTFYQGNRDKFEAPFCKLKKRSRIKHPKTVDIALHGLETKEWIEVARYAKHGKGRGLRVKANEYWLTFKHDFKRF